MAPEEQVTNLQRIDGSDEQTEECELLIARTAIPVGHTHEAIDAYFGRYTATFAIFY
jgi:hypothetical protein